MTKNEIIIEGIESYAFHGCLNEEALIGGRYITDICVVMDFSAAAHEDNLNKTVDYVTVYNIVNDAMKIRSKLIEHVAQRILDKIKNQWSNLIEVKVKVTKIAPPMNGNVAKVSVVITA